MTWKYFNPAPFIPAKKTAICNDQKCNLETFASPELDVRALACPGPVVRMKQQFDSMDAGETVKLLALLSFEPDLRNWIASTGNTLVGIEKKVDYLEAVIRKVGAVPQTSGVLTQGHGGHGGHT